MISLGPSLKTYSQIDWAKSLVLHEEEVLKEEIGHYKGGHPMKGLHKQYYLGILCLERRKLNGLVNLNAHQLCLDH